MLLTKICVFICFRDVSFETYQHSNKIKLKRKGLRCSFRPKWVSLSTSWMYQQMSNKVKPKKKGVRSCFLTKVSLSQGPLSASGSYPSSQPVCQNFILEWFWLETRNRDKIKLKLNQNNLLVDGRGFLQLHFLCQ